MEAAELLRSQFEQVHQFMEMTIADCSQEVLDRKDADWTINKIGAIYTHVLIAEDVMVNSFVRGDEPLLIRDGWGEKFGITDPSPMQMEDYSDYKVDLPVLREYAAAVAKETDSFFASATEADLYKEVESPAGKMSALKFLANIGLTHVPGHWGEIAALKGVQGLKGLPF